MTRLHCQSIIFVLTALFCLPSNAFADVVQVPNLPGFGNTQNTLPFSGFGQTRYQQIYAASEFPHDGIIDKIMFRHDELTDVLYGPTDIDVQVAFAYAATTVNTASTTFANEHR
jgi:hypothetical protein